MQPGTFVGVWKQNIVIVPCTIFVAEADSVLKASILNTSTKEILTIKGCPGRVDIPGSRKPSIISYPGASDSSSIYGDNYNIYLDLNCWFSYNTDTFYYYTKRGNDSIAITGNRIN